MDGAVYLGVPSLGGVCPDGARHSIGIPSLGGECPDGVNVSPKVLENHVGTPGPSLGVLCVTAP